MLAAPLLTFLLLQTPASPEPAAQPARADSVPLSLWTHPDFPAGLEFGNATGISFGDYDADGWSDIFAHSSGHLWRNLSGESWLLVADLDSILPLPAQRYGSSFGDYNNDGLPDIGTEPRKGPTGYDECFHLLRNLGGGPNFVDVAIDPAILDLQPCDADSETISWADVDGDGDLDMFLPVYPPNAGSIDNKFLHNRGPTGPNGAYRFTEEAAAAGVLVPAGAARPEGSWFFDSDADGDLDLYSNGTLYRNLSGVDTPAFEFLKATSSGIKKRATVDEGVVFLDYDMDGDYDLLLSYTGLAGMRLWEAYGDGTYFETPESLIEDHRSGATFGLSAADWDNDGDIDFQAMEVFRTNRMVEEGKRFFELATTSIPPDHMRSATPAWADWDQDGDLDMAIGNGMFGSFLYQNDVYDQNTPFAEKRNLRVRVMRDSTTVAAGTETEYGASVEVRVKGESRPLRRKQLLSSAAGYLNQNEYVLSFALPEDPTPGDPGSDVRFDLSVEFPSLPELGFHRVDKFVNPALGNLDLTTLGEDREVTVFRSGKVVIHGCELAPAPAADPKLVTSSGGLVAPTQDLGLDDPQTATSSMEFVGIEIDTAAASGPLHLKEILLDGRPGASFPCNGKQANILLWDVSDPANPVLAPGGRLRRFLDLRNRRGHFDVDLALQPGRVYRLVALVESFRPTPIVAPVPHGSFELSGGLHYTDPAPCTGAAAAAASLLTTEVFLAVRISEQAARRWADLGGGAPGGAFSPQLAASGGSAVGDAVVLELSGAPPLAKAVVAAGTRITCKPFRGLPLVPAAEIVLTGLVTDANGDLTLAGTWPATVGRGTPLFIQAFAQDPSAPQGAAASNVLARLGDG